MSVDADFLAYLSRELSRTRETAASVIDRAEALSDLLVMADSEAAGRNQTWLSQQQFIDNPRTEHERAVIAALLTRVWPETSNE